jgi:Zn-dependent metalloprotease
MSICFIIPPHMLSEIRRNGNSEEKVWAERSMKMSQEIRFKRQEINDAKKVVEKNISVKESLKKRIIYTANNQANLPGKEIGKEGEPPSDEAGNQAFIGTGATYDLYFNIYQRISIDNKGMPIISTVHYSEKYDNAFWDGNQMVYGDGDGQLFNLFTKPVDVTGHELTHGVTQYSANLTYKDQSGALNESFSDVFGILVKQQLLNQSADEADWLIGEGIFTSKVNGKALRSMQSPGSAYDDKVLGKDPQPSDMSGFVNTPDDNGGVHINSGIPNHAFYLAAKEIGGNAWEKAGKIWYQTLTNAIKQDTNFVDCASATIEVAKGLFGAESKEQNAVTMAWKKVEVI